VIITEEKKPTWYPDKFPIDKDFGYDFILGMISELGFSI
jgi:hypothetical protein